MIYLFFRGALDKKVIFLSAKKPYTTKMSDNRRYDVEDARAFAGARPNILVQLMDKYPEIFRRVKCTLLPNPNYDFRFHDIQNLLLGDIRMYCENPRVSQTDMLNLPDCKEKYRGFSANPNCTIELVQLLKDKDWDYYVLFKNPAICAAHLRVVFKDLMDNEPFLSLYTAILYNPTITIEVFEECRRHYKYGIKHYNILAQNRGIYPCDLKRVCAKDAHDIVKYKNLVTQNPHVTIEDLREIGVVSCRWYDYGDMDLKHLQGIFVNDDDKATLSTNPNKTLNCFLNCHKLLDETYFVVNPNAPLDYLCKKIESVHDPEDVCGMICRNLFRWHPVLYEKEKNRKIIKAEVIRSGSVPNDIAAMIASYC